MASKPPDYADICRAQGTKPVPKVQMTIEGKEPSLRLLASEVPMTVTSTQDLDFRCLFLALEMNLGNIRELAISGYALTSSSLALLTSGLASSQSIALLSLDSADLGDLEGLQVLSQGLATSQGLLSLSLARNR